jgi:hypothetical protein
MFNEESCVRCVQLAGSFYKQNLQSVADAMDEDADSAKAAQMIEQWKEADESLTKLEGGETPVWPSRVQISSNLRVGYRMSRKFGFMTTSEFLDEFDVEAKTIIGLRTVSKWNEEGSRKIDGIAFRPVVGDDLRFRMYETFTECTDEQDVTILTHDERLRQKEPQETMARLVKDAAAEHPLVTRGMS